MTIQKLEELLNQQESEKLDFKQALSLEKESEKKEFVKDVSAIANSRGGRLEPPIPYTPSMRRSITPLCTGTIGTVPERSSYILIQKK